MIDRKLLVFGIVILGFAFAVLVAFAGRSTSFSSLVARPRTNMAEGYSDFDGDVDVRIHRVAAGENLIQILDRGRSVVCYGRMNPGGAATISCQKYAEPPKKD